ncbi:MAG: chitinase [Flavobacteriales bacterium]|nr:chitinase [Flavobacteriales bacterium]
MRALIPAFLLAIPFMASAQVHDLVGYWHNWNDANAPYLQLDQTDPRYTIIDIAFAEPLAGTTHNMVFTPSGTPQNEFIAAVGALQAQGKKVIISIGGANATVHLDSDAERDEFVSSMLDIITTYGFDGIDIDLEGSSVSSTGGTIISPVDAPIIRLIDAIEAIGDAFEVQNGVPMMLTMAPETAYVQGGMSAFGGIWGAYLPIIDALRDRIDILHVQLYNSGSMYGIDGSIYTQGTADFIVSQTEAVLQGFGTGGGFFGPLPAEKVAIGLPACQNAAGGGYVDPTDLAAAVEYLLGTGPQPGSYQRLSTYPSLRGLMTWSINWDAVSSCATSFELAQSYEDIFGISTSLDTNAGITSPAIWPTVLSPGATLHVEGQDEFNAILIDPTGRTVMNGTTFNGNIALSEGIAPGHYIFFAGSPSGKMLSSRIAIVAP